MTARRGYALLMLGVILFTIYGSLVPFHYQRRSGGDAVHAFAWAMRTRIVVESRSDLIANLLLGVPLGFCLLGAVRADRRAGGVNPLILVVGLWPACIAFAAAIEFAQLYFPGRTCSATDIIAQACGAAIGMMLWLSIGQRLTDWLRKVWLDPRTGGVAGRVFIAYLGVILFVQLLPLDLTISPHAIYHKFRDQQGTLTPFGELYRADGSSVPDRWGKVQTWIELFGLYLPVGLILGRFPWRSWAAVPLVAVGGVLLGLMMEGAQLFVSRHPSTADALIGATGVFVGWAVVRATARRGRIGLESALILGQLWFAVLAVAHWLPFDFGHARTSKINWIPFADAETKNYLGALDGALTKIILFVPFGVLTAAFGERSTGWRRPILAVGLAVGIAAMLEVGQVFLSERYPSTSDLFLAAAGALAGALVAQRLRNTEMA